MAKTNEHDKASNRPFGGRIRRYAKVTSTMGGLAARVAGERYLGCLLYTSPSPRDPT